MPGSVAVPPRRKPQRDVAARILHRQSDESVGEKNVCLHDNGSCVVKVRADGHGVPEGRRAVVVVREGRASVFGLEPHAEDGVVLHLVGGAVGDEED